jgi:hypothetical protein
VQFHNGATADADVWFAQTGSIPPCAKRPWGQNRRAFRGMWPIAGWFRRRASRISGSSSWRPHGGGRTITSFTILLPPARATSIGSRLLPANGASSPGPPGGEVADALNEFEGWHPQVRAIIGSVDATNRWALYDRDPAPAMDRWTRDTDGRRGARDASLHGEGAVQAIEDAAVLAKCLKQADAHDADAALRRYEQTRKPRASRCQEGSGRNGVNVPSCRRRGSTKSRRQLGVGHDRPAPPEQGLALRPRRRSRIRARVKSARAQRIMHALLDSHFSHSGRTAPL